ncbi:MAG: RNB domain-containing ribonuclease [Candidatus Eisenbacteria bacterium]|nr:RNB domain-containing ribonuclease [Candidatus Eisenbacteria bacterium]
MTTTRIGQRSLLLHIARQAMLERGLQPDFPDDAIREAGRATSSGPPFDERLHDLRNLPWCSIDNDDSRDLDQLTFASLSPGGETRALVAIADLGDTVLPDSALDAHAYANTTSIYTPPHIFPMLPERLSTDLTSLGPGEDRIAIVVELPGEHDAPSRQPAVFRAVVRNHAKLTYAAVGAWLEGTGEAPEALAADAALRLSLRTQDEIARRLRAHRHELGALELETIEVRARFQDDQVATLDAEARNRAKDLIEDFMISANGVIAKFLTSRHYPVLRRVVRNPERWSRIVDIAAQYGDRLPGAPDAGSLHDFLVRRRAEDLEGFPDLSLTIIKLLGRGSYEASFPGDAVTGHFGLAVSDYTHSTAPNRRYPDLLTQRLVRAALLEEPCPLTQDELRGIAAHCTRKEDDVQKVERLLRKATAACLLEGREGEEFDGIVTGASAKGTWVRLFTPPVEGRVERNAEGLDVGDRVRVRLLGTDVERGFIDFANTRHHPVGSKTR